LSDESGSVDATPKIGEESPRFLEKRFPGLGEAHAALQPLEECASDLFFELSYLPRQSRLHDAQSLGGAPGMLFFAHGDEIAKVPQLHKDSNSATVSVSCHQSIGSYHSSTAP